ncbi:hypothetical protein CJ203_08945 [Corynebacterium tuscaniense]|uniref:Uncharacterized protein n=1 Tax=Corynebacterium tuscaniense TaxID=302449 RepID=A0A2N6T3B2_9CORY|nr:hypothetical protein [Corynebacterium tuscaniense]PMC63819.1 hypothetical protein CJ203_08945 [Corynebacterium tuscaniense]
MAVEEDAAAIEFATRQNLTDGPAGPQMYQNLMAELGLRPDAENARPGGIAPAVPRPLVLIPLEEQIKIMGGAGDDVILGLTDGTTMTGAEFLAQNFADVLEVAMFHPQEGPRQPV